MRAAAGTNDRLEIITERLRLRELRSEDWRELLRYQSDPRYLRLYPWATRTLEAVQSFLQPLVEWQYEHPRSRFQFAITFRGEEALIGLVGIRRASPYASDSDVGYELAPQFWGRGYATEAAGALVRLGFEELGLERLWASCLADNAGSRRVLEKLAMHVVPGWEEWVWMKGRWWENLRYEVTREEWQRYARYAENDR